MRDFLCLYLRYGEKMSSYRWRCPCISAQKCRRENEAGRGLGKGKGSAWRLDTYTARQYIKRHPWHAFFFEVGIYVIVTQIPTSTYQTVALCMCR